jgi:hypothetical protein
MANHTSVKEVLMELGDETEYYTVKSGDSEPLDIRLGKRHITYRPDVYFITSQGKILIFEIAFTEDERAIVGEDCLASLVPNAVKFFILFDNEDWAEYVKPFVTIVDEQIRDEKGKCRLRYKAGVISIPEKLGNNKTNIRRFLLRSKKVKRWLE